VSRQIVPSILLEAVGGKKKDAARAHRVMKAMMQMTKLDLKTLKQAAAAKA